MANDLSTCNCCPTVSPCICSGYAAPCCWSMSGNTHCSFSPQSKMCLPSANYSFNNQGLWGGCLWMTESTWCIVEPESGSSSYFPRESRLVWALRHIPLAPIGEYELILCINGFNSTTGALTQLNLLELARWKPEISYDPMFDTSPHVFKFDRLLFYASRFPSVINCDYPSGCGTSVVADGSNLPQSITLTPSCFISTDSCLTGTWPTGCTVGTNDPPIDGTGCDICSTGSFCSDGMLPANCTWVWNAVGEVWEVTSDDCSNSPDSGCGCVPMLTGCDTEDPGAPSLTTGPCYDAASHSEGVRVCDP